MQSCHNASFTFCLIISSFTSSVYKRNYLSCNENLGKVSDRLTLGFLAGLSKSNEGDDPPKARMRDNISEENFARIFFIIFGIVAGLAGGSTKDKAAAGSSTLIV